MEGGHLSEFGHDQAEVEIIGRVHAGAIQPGYGGRRQGLSLPRRKRLFVVVGDELLKGFCLRR